MRNKILFLTLITLNACMVGPDYHKPELAYKSDIPGFLAENTNPDFSEWWKNFNDPILNKLVERTIEDNLDIKMALSRIAESRAMTWELSISTLPDVTAVGGYLKSQSSPARVPFVDNSAFRKIELYRAGFDATWEIDLFGRSRRAIQAAGADEAATEASLRDVIVSSIAESANLYFQLRSAQEKLDLINALIRSEQQSFKLNQAAFEIGELAKENILIQENYLISLFQQRSLAKANVKTFLNAIQVISGGISDDLYNKLEQSHELRSRDYLPQIGDAAGLFKRRADVRAAESRLEAASARIGVATGNLYPKVSITGSWGEETNKLQGLGEFHTSPAYSISPQLSWKIFDIEETIANIKTADARFQTALMEYHKTVLSALNDLESKLSNFRASEANLKLMNKSTKNQIAITQIAKAKSRYGASSKQDYLKSQQELINKRIQFLESRYTYNQSLIALFKSLGGGWEGLTEEERLE